ncbi:hypothetical protein ANCCEY_04504 [Ancylostoma ceylanicum]|uniref:Uncharacterized protein n=1 Tax=Ancylostoma ceylanicum TaxID=53326 RepID=A0A0D6LX56_9BILA|nr:hypothetical protein ANCCEY_04504 [Ancylostoma ceylanicum]
MNLQLRPFIGTEDRKLRSWLGHEMCFYFAWTIFFFIAASVLAVAAARFAATGGWAVAAV